MATIRVTRCDECRRRKRKCDAKKPCSSCLDRSVECRYTYEVPKFIHVSNVDGKSTHATTDSGVGSHESNAASRPEVELNVRRYLDPVEGKGAYHVLGSSKKDMRTILPRRSLQASRDPVSVEHAVSNATSSLQREFILVLESATEPGLHMRLLGDWLWMIIPKIGTSPVLDLSVECVIFAHRARSSPDSNASDLIQLGRQRYGQALVCIQQAVANSIVTVEMVAASKLLATFETLITTEVDGWVSHLYGAIELLLTIGPDACTGEFERSLLHATYTQAWLQGVMIDQPSAFDDPEWLAILSPLTIEHGSGRQYGHAYIFTRLPRLTMLARALRRRDDRLLAEEAKILAVELLAALYEIDETADHSTIMRRTAHQRNANLVPHSFDFRTEDFQDVMRLNVIWASKILLAGLCQVLQQCSASIRSESPEKLQEEERRCAIFICQAIDYAEQPPYGTTRMIVFMQIAWGVFWRHAHCETVDMEAGMADVRKNDLAMAEWLRRRINDFLGAVNARPVQNAGLAWLSDRAMGTDEPLQEPRPEDTGSLFERSLQDSISAMRTTRTMEASSVDFAQLGGIGDFHIPMRPGT